MKNSPRVDLLPFKIFAEGEKNKQSVSQKKHTSKTQVVRLSSRGLITVSLSCNNKRKSHCTVTHRKRAAIHRRLSDLIAPVNAMARAAVSGPTGTSKPIAADES